MKIRLLAFVLVLVLSSLILLSACAELTDEETPPVELRLSIGVGGESSISVPERLINPELGQMVFGDGTALSAGDLKPVWSALEKQLEVDFVDKYSEGHIRGESLSEVDVIFGTLDELDALAREGELVMLSSHIKSLENYRDLMWGGSIAYSFYSMTSSGSTGVFVAPTIYNTPYFGLVPFINAEKVKQLLDGDGSYSSGVYRPLGGVELDCYMPTSGTVSVRVLTSDGSSTSSIRKKYTVAGNALANLTVMSSVGAYSFDAVNSFRNYVDDAYDGAYGVERSNLFLGTRAAWDADELAALLICARSCSESPDDFVGIAFDNVDEALEAFASMYGARGMGATDDYGYFDPDGIFHDARTEEDIYFVANKLSEWINCGIVTLSSDKKADAIVVFDDVAPENGFAQALMPISRWYNGEEYDDGVDIGSYTRYSDSILTVGEYGIAISKAGVGSDAERLNAALKLINYAYSDAGLKLVTYGGTDCIATVDGAEQYMTLFGKEISKVKDSLYSAAQAAGYSSVSRYLIDYYGAGVCFGSATEQSLAAMNGSEAYSLLNTAIQRNLVKIRSYEWQDNMWYSCPPRFMPYSATEIEALANASGYILETGNSECFRSTIRGIAVGGIGSIGYRDFASLVLDLQEMWNGERLLFAKRKGYSRLREIYDEYLGEIEY